ncbi:MAG: cobalamin-binding protein [Ignavibacteriae bacterium]|nr:cobalamin-binding protein [Ignavibacteriota bacterium]
MHKIFFIVVLLSTSLHSSFAQQRIRVTDDLTREIVLAKPAQRIVSLAPSITEALFAIGAGSQIVGVTDFCDYPAEAKAKSRVGGIINPNIEAIVSVKPDLIVLSMEGNVREDFEKLKSLGVPLFVTNPRDLKGIYRSLDQLGALTGKSTTAMQLIRSLHVRADFVMKKAAQQRPTSLLMIVSLQPIIVVGKNTFLAELISLAGGMNTAVKASSTYPTYSREAVLKDNPDVLIFMSDILANPSDLVALYPEWSRLRAIQLNNVFTINPDIASRPGPRAVEGLEALYELIH